MLRLSSFGMNGDEKSPVWKWQIASYFYLGGISAGAYLLGRIADRAGGRKIANLTRVASAVALTTIIPCPGLLIWDLGDPKRFHHMLRVFKPGTPMNLGSWAITMFGAHTAFDVMRQHLNTQHRHVGWREPGMLRKLMNNGTLMMIHDAAGVPLALVVASYTGVLLNCTSNPLSCKNPWLGPLFAASSLSTGAEAISVVMDWRNDKPQGQQALERVDTIAHLVELLLMRGFLKHAGENARPLRSGRMKKYHQFSTAALIGAEVLKYLPAPKQLERPKRMLSMALGLAGGFALRWGMVFGGHEAAADPHLSRFVSRPRSAPGRRPAIGSRVVPSAITATLPAPASAH